MTTNLHKMIKMYPFNEDTTSSVDCKITPADIEQSHFSLHLDKIFVSSLQLKAAIRAFLQKKKTDTAQQFLQVASAEHGCHSQNKDT